MTDLKLSLVQTPLVWEEPKANRTQIAEMIHAHAEDTDVYVLPEMFTTGFSMAPESIAETYSPDMDTLIWMKELAAAKNAVITGSVSVKEGEAYFNRLFWVSPDGKVQSYNKRHLFTFANEHHSYTRGEERLIVDYKGWRICPLICYDLRFPVWSRNNKLPDAQPYDLLIYVANWPEVRRSPWMKLLYARAIENQAYLVGVNRIGEDGNGIAYSGDSLLLDPKGEDILNPGREKGIFTATLSASELRDFREKFPVLYDADDFSI